MKLFETEVSGSHSSQPCYQKPMELSRDLKISAEGSDSAWIMILQKKKEWTFGNGYAPNMWHTFSRNGKYIMP